MLIIVNYVNYVNYVNIMLVNYVEYYEILSPHQYGFREDFRAPDAIFTLRSLVSHYKNNMNKPVYSCFMISLKLLTR